MDITAEAKHIRISPRKVRIVAAAVKHLAPTVALSQLALLPKRAAAPIAKVIESALANAVNNAKLPVENLAIKSITVSGGTALKRWRPVSRGRAHAYKKRASHIRVVVTDEIKPVLAVAASAKKEEVKEKKNGTKS